VTPWSKASSDRSENDLKPEISRRSRRIAVPCPYKEIDHGTDGPALNKRQPGQPDSAVSINVLALPGAEALHWESRTHQPVKRRSV
jgi:hypothetical protein